MKPEDWKDIEWFTEKEVMATGADVAKVTKTLMMRLDDLRDCVGAMILAHNGMTSGDHKSIGHPEGRAADFSLRSNLAPDKVVKSALACGFKKIGTYWNGVAYSYHVELAQDYAFWMATKAAPGPDHKWTYHPVNFDPRKAEA